MINNAHWLGNYGRASVSVTHVEWNTFVSPFTQARYALISTGNVANVIIYAKLISIIFIKPVDGSRQGRPRDAQEDVHSSRLPIDRGTMDAEGCLLPQVKVNQQHQRQTWIREYRL